MQRLEHPKGVKPVVEGEKVGQEGEEGGAEAIPLEVVGEGVKRGDQVGSSNIESCMYYIFHGVGRYS